jgi:hydroxyacylglutathione hydrolase
MPQIIPVDLGLVYAYIVKGEEKVILVDSGFPGQENKILRALDKNNVRREDVSLIVITHGDIDHYGSSAALRKLLNVPVLVHRSDGHILRTGVNRKIRPHKLFGYVMKYTALIVTALTKHRYKPFEPDVTVDTETLSLVKYGIDGYLLHTPGETDGSISLVLSDGRMIVGDLFGSILPRMAMPAYSPFSHNLDDVRKSLKKVLALGPTIIYSGHSKPVTVSKYLKKLRSLAAG